MAEIVVPVKVLDLPRVKDMLQQAADRIAELERERDEWEERYEDLLAAVGGVWPG